MKNCSEYDDWGFQKVIIACNNRVELWQGTFYSTLNILLLKTVQMQDVFCKQVSQYPWLWKNCSHIHCMHQEPWTCKTEIKNWKLLYI